MNLFTLRSIVCYNVVFYYGYIQPIIITYDIITKNDKRNEDIRKYLVYWTVNWLFIALDTIISIIYGQYINRFPPEIRVILIYFLLRSNHNGINYVYQSILEPIFVIHESFIDMKVAEVSSRFNVVISKIIKTVGWNILFSNDGILNTIGLIDCYKYIYQMILYDNTIANDINSSVNSPDKSSLSISRRILSDITQLLQEGLIVHASYNLNKLIYCRCQLHELNKNYLSLHFITMNQNDSKKDLLIPLILVKSIDMIYEDNDEKTSGDDHLNNSIFEINFKNTDQSLFISMSSGDDCEALVGGLQVYCASVKAKSNRLISKAISISKRRTFSQHYAFNTWKRYTVS